MPIVDKDTGEPVNAYHPMVPLIISSKGRDCTQTDGLLDSGSDGVVIPMGLAEYLGLELNRTERPMMVANGRSVERLTSKVTLTLGRAGRYCDPIEAEVNVPAEGSPPILIGRDPVFRLFTITFVEAERRLEMTPYRRGRFPV
ncbi:MAG: retropepsin-like aspartic protease [Thermoplasmata archaeon]